MLDKLAKAFPILRREVTNLSAEVERLKVRPIIKDGKDGLPGPSGKNGVDGEPGEQGLRGEQGERGRDGRDGSVGAAGAEGPRGQIGEQGERGLPGPRGPQGPKGDKGERGAQGEQGVKGDTGEAGKDGASITRVDIQKGVLSVWIGGEKREVGKVGNGAQIPGAFTPNAGGGGFGKKVRLPNDNTVYITKQADFAVQDETTITLQAKCIYVMAADVVVDKPFILEDGVVITANNINGYTLTYTGAGVMFTGTDVGFNPRDITLDCPNAEVFDIRDLVGAVKRVIVYNVFVTSAAKYGTFQDLNALEFINSGTGDVADGLTLLGTAGLVLSIGRLALQSTSNTFVGIDFGTSQFLINEINNLIVNGVPGGIGISGLVDNGNVPVGRRAMVSDSEFINVTPLQNIGVNDIRWEFTTNSPLANSRNAADLFLTGGAETVTINTSGVFEEIGVPGAGGVSWDSDIQDRFTVGTDGVITYDGEIDIEVQITGTATIEKVGGGNNELEVRIAKNWLPGQSGLEKSRAITQNGTPTSVPLSALIPMSNGDNIRAIFANNDSTSNIIAQVTSIDVVGG